MAREDLDLQPRLSDDDVVGQYRIVQFLGRGGMAEVYEAKDLTLGRRVALKTPRADIGSRHRIQRFVKEYQKAALIDHQNVITIFNAGEENGIHYLVMQYVEGMDLAEFLRERGEAFPWDAALRIIQRAARGLHAVHQQDLVHRDIKPSNIMLTADSNVLLMDFGLVRDVASDLTSLGEAIGTPCFMSPEQCRGEALDHRSDIYSLGATLYCLVTGRRPFEGPTLKVIQRVGKGKRPPPVRQLNPQMPEDVAMLIDKAMAYRPQARFETAQAFAKAVSHLLQTHRSEETENVDTVSVSAERLATQPASDSRPALPPVDLTPISAVTDNRRQWIVGLGVFGIAIVAVAVALLIGRKEPTPADQPDYPGMVRVEKGMVDVGNSETKLRRFLEQFLDDKKIRTALEICTEGGMDRVEVDAFWIDQYEVTNAEYAEFVRQTSHRPPSYWSGTSPPTGREDHPVVHITYSDAEAYAAWAGKKIPTRGQWLRAFRGDKDWLLPWGDTYDVTWANVSDNPSFKRSTSPVKSTPKDVSLFGVYNLAGNASEFVRGTFFHRGQPYRMGKGGEYKGLGCVYAMAPMFSKYALDHSDPGVGVRCVVEEP